MDRFARILPLTALGIAVALFAQDAAALDGVVGPGNCDEDGFANVLASVDGSGGGTVTFACGPGPVVIASTYYKTISGAVVVDGGGSIVLDGGGAAAFVQVFFSAHATLRGLTLRHGVFNGAHAIENFGELSLDRVSVVDNVSSEAAVVNYGTLHVADSTFDGNVSNADGGAIYNDIGASANISGSTFVANGAANGAAIRSAGALGVVNSTFSGNQASLGGGGIYQADGGAAFIEFATFVGNGGVFGAGIYNDGSGSSAMTIGESLLAGNADGNCDGVIASAGYNLSDDTHCGGAFTSTGDVNGATLPMLALADNGGPTATSAPGAGNAAIDHVPGGECTQVYDQRGAARPFGAGCDSGAVELGATVDRIFTNGFDGG